MEPSHGTGNYTCNTRAARRNEKITKEKLYCFIWFNGHMIVNGTIEITNEFRLTIKKNG